MDNRSQIGNVSLHRPLLICDGSEKVVQALVEQIKGSAWWPSEAIFGFSLGLDGAIDLKHEKKFNEKSSRALFEYLMKSQAKKDGQ